LFKPSVTAYNNVLLVLLLLLLLLGDTCVLENTAPEISANDLTGS